MKTKKTHADACRKRRVLVLSPYFKPGSKGGGPIQSLHHLAGNLKSIEFYVLTNDTDLGERDRYQIAENGVSKIGKSRVVWISNSDRVCLIGFARKFLFLLRTRDIDAIYFNALFNFHFFVFPLLLLRFFRHKKRVLIAPRGLLCVGAINRGWLKKTLYIRCVWKLLGLSQYGLHFVSDKEANESVALLSKLLRREKVVRRTYVIPNFGIPFDKLQCDRAIACRQASADAMQLRVMWHSRIVPRKNIEACLDVLRKMKRQVRFRIYGVIEDSDYWSTIQKSLSSGMPENVTVEYMGATHADMLFNIYCDNDIFLFLTVGESFGHVVHETLCFGMPTVLSDDTPWVGTDNKLVSIFSLNNPTPVARFLDEFGSACADSQAVGEYLVAITDNVECIRGYNKMFGS